MHAVIENMLSPYTKRTYCYNQSDSEIQQPPTRILWAQSLLHIGLWPFIIQHEMQNNGEHES